MRLDAFLVVQVLSALVVGCAAPAPSRPSVDPTLTPEQIVRGLTSRKLTSSGTSPGGYGLAAFKPYLRPLELRCQADGGLFLAFDPSEIVFDFRDANSVQHRARVSMPQRLACRGTSQAIWGAAIRYSDTTFFPSSWAGEVYYYATIQLTFEAGQTAGPGSSGIAAGADPCQPARERYTQLLRTAPRVGMKVRFGVIVDVRHPLVLVQYDDLGRKANGREQEWIQASALAPGSNCPD
jgi:hypothetical protein